MAQSERVEKLLATIQILQNAATGLVKEWQKEDKASQQEEWVGSKLPSVEIYNATRTIMASCGLIGELVDEPQSRLLTVACEYFEARALHIASEHRIADLVANADPKVGVHIDVLAKATGIDSRKLARVLRTLCSAHIFAEVQNDYFANNSVSKTLVHNEPLRAYIVSLALDIYSASDKLPQILVDPIKGKSNDVKVTAFQEALNTKLSRWEWLEEGVKQPDGTVTRRPELDIFGLAMLGGGRVLGTPLYHDFPWESLGNSLIVDVGGGVGGMSMDLAKRYPNLRFVVQDRAQVITQARTVWEKEFPQALESRVTLMPHNFFDENPVKGPDAFLLRYILHDWEDDRCVDILKGLTPSMGPNTRVLIADQVMNTTVGCPELQSAPAPLPANYGAFTKFAHCRDLDMMTIINGMERTPAMVRDLARRAGLELSRIWECRGIVSFCELRLPQSA
ncbi:S-adenosyl-L-methionine-dependent methyltransferase [Pleurotus eryngii]|uniref:S-adenosyl-L-methionine-dependent methyltransferase n=1 Tax=Pleurotus eryngii TaxID=5323 RepID=A0A9P5ZT85_PLEER|nr:S-adenosyl-L-methionine-dependent methyltransferase [Pleurotus eryngii]